MSAPTNMKKFHGFTLIEIIFVITLTLLISSALIYASDSFSKSGKLLQAKIQKTQWEDIIKDFYERNYTDIIYHPKFILKTEISPVTITATLGFSPGDVPTAPFSSGYRCTHDEKVFALMQDGREKLPAQDREGNSLLFCMSHIYSEGSVEGFKIPRRKLAIYFGATITLKHASAELCTLGSGNFICHDGGGIFLRKFKNTKKKIDNLYEKLNSYAHEEYNYGQDGAHIDYFHNFIETNSSTTTLTLRARGRWRNAVGLPPLWIEGSVTATVHNFNYSVVKPAWLARYNQRSGGIDKNSCLHEPAGLYSGVISEDTPSPFIPGQCSRNTATTANLAYNFDYYHVVFTQTVNGVSSKKTVYLKEKIDVLDEDIFDAFGAPILFDNSSAATRNPYHLDHAKRTPPYNARIVATIPQVEQRYFQGFPGTVIMNKYESTNDPDALAQEANVPSIRAYNRGMNRLRSIINQYSCYDPYIVNKTPFSYSYKIRERNCGNNFGHVFRAPEDTAPIGNVNVMKYPVKFYEKYIESPG